MKKTISILAAIVLFMVGFWGIDAVAEKNGVDLFGSISVFKEKQKKHQDKGREKGKEDDPPKHTATRLGGRKSTDSHREKGKKKDGKPYHTSIKKSGKKAGDPEREKDKPDDSRRGGAVKFGGE